MPVCRARPTTRDRRAAGHTGIICPMTPHLSFITLGVDDLERAVAFYRDGLGLATPGIVGREFEFGAVAFFRLQGGLRLALWPRASLAAETALAVPPAPKPGQAAAGFALAHNVGSPAAVEALLAQAVAAGATLVKPAAPTFYGGHAGWFQDPDGHLWEIAWNPHLAALG
jgi:catechol 2,3-dioxygenase-like lactoylglutathione lyase family enzyme